MSLPEMGKLCPSARAGWREKSCAALLHDPVGVLTDRRRWPDHLCYGVMVESCRLWAVENDQQRAGLYPLPLDDGRYALLALRVRFRRSSLDLFALEGYKPPAENADDWLWVGGLAYSLRGRDDTSLLHVISQAHDWWGHISIEKILGRPAGSGTYASREEFMAALAVANREVRIEGLAFTQPAVERALGVNHGDGRQLRKWLCQYEVSWSEAKRL